jgi:hypothetical protein
VPASSVIKSRHCSRCNSFAPKRVKAGTQDTGLPWIGQRGRVCDRPCLLNLLGQSRPALPLPAAKTHSFNLLTCDRNRGQHSRRKCDGTGSSLSGRPTCLKVGRRQFHRRANPTRRLVATTVSPFASTCAAADTELFREPRVLPACVGQCGPGGVCPALCDDQKSIGVTPQSVLSWRAPYRSRRRAL